MMQNANMTEKEIVKKLHSLKNIKPDETWKKQSQEVLFSQISGGETGIEIKPIKLGFEEIVKHYYLSSLKFAVQPAISVLVVVSAFIGGGLYGVVAAKDSKPGDSLYIAKMISEKTQYALTFDQKQKAKLGITFAVNRTKEMEEIIKKDQGQKNKEETTKLIEQFRKEIDNTKEKIKNITPIAKQPEAPVVLKQAVRQENTAKKSQAAKKDDKKLDKIENQEVFSANMDKDNKRMEIAEQSEPGAVQDPAQILDEAQELFAKQDFKGTMDKLEKATEVIENTDPRSIETSSTSSEDKK